MKAKLLRTDAPFVRVPTRRAVPRLVRKPLNVGVALALVASALLSGLTFAGAMSALPTSVPLLLGGWILGVGATFAVPLLVVRLAVAVLERLD